MVKVNIYLSTLERLKANATDYDTRFTEGNLALFSKIVEKDSYKISYGFSYGSTPKTSTFACKLSAEPYYIKAFVTYDAIKVTKVKDGTETTVFLGCKPTIKRTYETSDWWSETITFNDYVSDLSDIVFHTSDTTTDGTTTVTEIKDDDWTWSISVEDGYKVCDSTDRTKSLVHYLFDNWLNKDRESLSFTLHCDFSNTDTVTSFSVQASDKVLNIWQELLKQQGLAVYIIGFDVYIIDMLADPTTTAKVIDSVECNATYNVKPYIEHTIPALRVPKVITTFTAQELYDSGKIPVAKGSIGMVDGSMGIKPKWYPDENTALYAEPSFTTELENYEVIRYYNMKWKYQTTVSLGTTRLYLYNGTEKVEKTLTKQGNWYGCTDSLSGKYLKYAVANYSLSQGNFTLTITGDVDVADYNAVIRPKSLYYSGSEEKATYVYTKEEGDRYMNALLYARDMEAKTYSFYSTEELDLNDICVLSHISEEGTYIRITDKQDNLDDFEGYTYTATVYSGTQVSTESYYIPASTNAPNVSQDFNFSVSRSLIVCDSDGNPLDSTAITARISLLKYYSVPTLLLDGTEVELTQDTQTVEDETVLLDSWHCEIDVSKIGTTSTLTAQLGDMTKTISIGKINNGYVGSNGWSQATINLYKRSSTEQTGFDGGQLIYYFSTGGLTGSLGTWSRTVPSGSEKLWVISASAFAQSTSDEIEISDWTTPAVLSENGTVGQDGYTVLTVLLYQRSTTTPSKPTATATYNFTTNTITGVSPWTLTVPSGTEPVWVISATASTRSTVEDDIEPSEWSTPQILVQNGTDGKDADPLTITKTSYTYGNSDTGTTKPSSFSADTKPVNGKYYWTKTSVTYSDNTTTDTYSVAYVGSDGKSGTDGAKIIVLSTNYDGGYYSGYSESKLQSLIDNQTSDTANVKSSAGINVGDIALSKCKMSDTGRFTYQMLKVTSITSTTVTGTTIGQTAGLNGATGAQGYSIIASLSREGKTDDWWTSYTAVGVSDTWDATSDICNKSRVGDLFTIVGTSTNGKAYTATVQITEVKSTQLVGTSISLVYSEKGATGDTGSTGTGYVVASLTYNSLDYYAGWTEAQITSCSNNYSDSWAVSTIEGIKVGDIALCKCKANDTGRYTFILCKVSSITTGKISGVNIGQTAGANGATGNGISSITETKSTEDGGENTLTITYTNGNSENFTVLNGTKGNHGDPARTYVTLTSGYDLNSCTAKDTVYVSSATAICNSLLNKPSTFVAGEVRVEVEWLGSNNYFAQYLWCKAGSTTKYYYRAYSAGTWGTWFELGNGIASTTVTYQAGSSNTTKPSGTWTSDVPATSASLPYLWTKTTFTYTNGSDPKDFYTVGIGADGTVVGGRNLFKKGSLRAGGNISSVNNQTGTVTLGTSNSDTYFYLKLHEAIYTTETYTISCTASNVPDGTYWTFPVTGQGNSKWALIINKNGRCTGTGSPLSNVSKGTEIILDDYSRPSSLSANIVLTDIKIEKGNKATDYTLAPEDALLESKTEYLGVQSSLPTSATNRSWLVAGDCCVYNSLVYIYSGSAWQKSSESTLDKSKIAYALSQSMKDVLSSVTGETITATEYGFFKNIITDIISANYIGAQTIELQDNGVIQSADYSEDSAVGFRLTSEGAFSAQGAFLSGVSLREGSTIVSDCLVTSNKDETKTISYTETFPTDNSRLYFVGLTDFFSSYTSGTIVKATISFKSSTKTWSATSFQYEQGSLFSKSKVFFYDNSGEVQFILTFTTMKKLLASEYSMSITLSGASSPAIQCGFEYNTWIGVEKGAKPSLSSILPSESKNADIQSGTFTQGSTVSDLSNGTLVISSSGVQATKNGTLYSCFTSSIFAQSKWINFNITYKTTPKGVYVSALNALDSGTKTIGSSDKHFTQAYIDTVNGNLKGNVTGNVSGNTTGTHTGNVNASGTSYVVYGAVFN